MTTGKPEDQCSATRTEQRGGLMAPNETISRRCVELRLHDGPHRDAFGVQWANYYGRVTA